MSERETVARIIDPAGWAYADSERDEFPADTHERIYGTTRLKESLTKADAILEARRRTTIASPGEAEGYVLVPVEPTNAMISAAIEAWESKDFPGPEAEFSAVYRAMIAARPSPADVGRDDQNKETT